MTLFAIPWLELSIAVPLAGAACVRVVRDALLASRVCLGFAGAALACAVLACTGFYAGHASATSWTLSGRSVLALDELNAPLLPLVALLHGLTALATARTKMGRFSFAGLLACGAVRLAAFACVDPWPLIGLLALDAFVPLFELRQRGSSGRLHAIHAGLFITLLVVGWACVDGGALAIGSALLAGAALVRTGAFPAQVWVTDVFEKGSFGMALLFATPLAGAYVAVRLVLPIAPDGVLESLGVAALGAAVYAAAMGVVERDARRYFAYLFVSHASLVLVGLGLHTPFAVTGAFVMWLSSALSLAGLGLTLRAIEARVGPLTLTEFRGLYSQSPSLAVCFLLTGLASVGFPGTSGFIAVELLVDEAVGAHLAVGLVVVMTAALNGIGVVRAYLMVFTGRRHTSGVSLGITPRERVAVLTLVALILGGGLLPQAYLDSRNRAAGTLLHGRAEAPHHP